MVFYAVVYGGVRGAPVVYQAFVLRQELLWGGGLAQCAANLSQSVAPGRFFLAVRILRVLRVFRVLRMVRYVGEAELIAQALAASRRKLRCLWPLCWR